MKTLALDLSTKSSGWSIYNDKELENFGCITASSSNLYKRIEKMGIELTTILKENKIDRIVIEDVVPDDVHNNGKVFRALMHLQGYIAFILSGFKLEPEYIVASHWRKLCGIKTGSGIHRESLKPKDIEFVKKQFGLDVNDDIADAICIGFAVVGGEVHDTVNTVEYVDFEFN
jgi:Holliday junction resolvasome RuvABC endonuclease subunit